MAKSLIWEAQTEVRIIKKMPLKLTLSQIHTQFDLRFKDGIRQYKKQLLLCSQFLLCRQKKKENKVRSMQKDKM